MAYIITPFRCKTCPFSFRLLGLRSTPLLFLLECLRSLDYFVETLEPPVFVELTSHHYFLAQSTMIDYSKTYAQVDLLEHALSTNVYRIPHLRIIKVGLAKYIIVFDSRR